MTDPNSQFKLVIKSKIKEPSHIPSKKPTFAERLNDFYLDHYFIFKTDYKYLQDFILEYILQEGTNYRQLWKKDRLLHVYSNEGKILISTNFREFAYIFNKNIEESLIPFSDKMLEMNKKIHGKGNVEKYLDFTNVKYCTILTDEEKEYLKRKKNPFKAFLKELIQKSKQIYAKN